nr:MFS transporter [Hephaestia mangrovi]
MAVLIVQLDTTVVNLAVDPIGSAFHADVATMQWVVDIYNLVYAVLLLTGGLLADVYGRRRVFMGGAIVFSAASLLCALSPAVWLLIAGRALAGLGAALLMPASLAILRVTWPDVHERGRALGIWAGCNGLALAIGPSAGGFLIAQFGWSAIFWAVMPLGLAALALSPIAVPESADPEGRRMDGRGQVLGAIALGALSLAAIEAHGTIWLAALALIVAGVASGLFLGAERALGDHALVPLGMFRSLTFLGAMIATTGMTFGMYGVMFLLPQTWQATGRLGPIGAGVALLPEAVFFVLVSPFSGWISDRLGRRMATAGGVGIIGCGLALIAMFAGARSLVVTEIGLALTGFGMGLATGPLMGAAVGAVESARSGTAAALINVARIAGATIGVAILGTVFAIGGKGVSGLRAAMLTGAAVQIASAAVAWRTTRRRGTDT